MPLPASLDFYKVARPALMDVFSAVDGWLSGQPRDETAFLNHLTGHLNRRRRACDVGVDLPIGMTTRLYLLHRRGQKQTDQYGADLALTVGVDPGAFLKTALFQF